MTSTDPSLRRSVRLNNRIYPAVVGVLLLLQLFLPNRAWLILLVGLGGALGVSFVWSVLLARGLDIDREMHFGWAQVGDHLLERFTLVNRSRAPASWVEVIDHSSLPDNYAGRALSIGRSDLKSWHARRVCHRRGLFTLGPTSLRSGDPFGIFTVTLHYPDSTTLLVTPPIVPLPAIQVAPGGRVGDGRPRPHSLERTASNAGLREYMPGDSLRYIHWPSSAHQGELVVRLLEGTSANDWWIFLDLNEPDQAGEGQESTQEVGIILAASLADRGLRNKRRVGLVSCGPDLTWLTPLADQSQRGRILKNLALAELGSRPLADLLGVARPALGQMVSLILITSSTDSAWVANLMPLLKRGAVATVLLLDPQSFGADRSSEPIERILTNLDVAHYRVKKDLLDRPEVRPEQKWVWDWYLTPTAPVDEAQSLSLGHASD